jgi:hypothetical protein
LKLGLLAEKQLDRSVVTANLVAERELAEGADAELEYAFRWRYRQSQCLESGIELYGELGEWEDFGSASGHERQLDPALPGKLRRASGRSAFK